MSSPTQPVVAKSDLGPSGSPRSPRRSTDSRSGRLEDWRKGLSVLERGWVITAGFFVLMALAPAVTPGNIPVLTDGLVLLLMAYAWNIVGGFLGELSFAHMIFWGIGGYGAVEVVNHSQPFLLWLVLLVAIAVVAGVLVAGLIRLSGLDGLLAVSIFTMVLGQIAITFAIGSTSLGGVEGKIAIALPPIGTNLFFLCLVVLAGAAAFTNVAVANSRFGRELLAIRDDVVAAEVAGIHVSRRRNQAYMLSAGFFAVGGAYQSYYSGFAIPDVTLGVATLILVSLAVFIGGAGTSMGPLLGTLIIYGLEVAALQVSTDADVSLYAQLTEFAVALLLLRLVIPRLKGLDLATAATRLIPGQRNRSLVAEEDIDPALSSKDAATDLVARGLSELDAPEQVGLEICGLRKSFGRLEVLRDVSFAIRPGEVVGIVGPNGAGKSTLCNLISGVTPASGGQIVLNGTDVTRVPSRRRASVGVGRSFQTPRLFSSLSLAQNLSISGSQVTEREAEIALNQMGIPDGGRRRGDDSQFFARRLTEVTKAALNGRSVLLLDEPLAGLTPDEHAVVLAVARKAADAGACVAIVEHLIPVLAPAVDRIVVLADGHMIADGPPAAVLQEEAVVDAYLGTPHQEEAE